MSPDKHTLDQLRIDRNVRTRSKAPLFFMLLLLLGGGMAGAAKWWYDQPQAIAVRTHLVTETTTGGERVLLNSSGYVTARREATVSSKVSGKVIEVLVEEGMTVEADQVLARIDSSNTEQSLRLAEAQTASAREALSETRVRLAQAQRDALRFAKMAEDGIGNLSDRDRSRAEAEALEAMLERQTADIAVAERQTSVWKQQMEDTVIRAPFAGVVTEKNAQPGEMISMMSSGGFTRTGICTIVDMSSLEIEVDVSETYINRVSAGQPVEATLDSYPDWRIPAKVIAIIPTADRQKATVKVRVAFNELDPRILPDMSVKVAFQDAEPAQPVSRHIEIPEAAVRQQEGRDIVWLVREGRVQPRPITVKETRDGNAIIAAGVNSGDRVVVEGFDQLADGASVTEAKG